MEEKLTVKDANIMAYKELAQVQVPAELTFSIGVHVGKALLILKDCIESMEKEEKAKQEAPEIELVEAQQEEKHEA